ncbi:hypothetical protein EWM64_g10333 [Hericium alpestre]|uniref:Uncharacterized protein n=1 Tax=Hericium alpestre TaxID=135208 RepID=A0A4Y9ZJS2_9AGAM|nr:hypothetical protein EWM64_g10333 [Hericium alpestre]
MQPFHPSSSYQYQQQTEQQPYSLLDEMLTEGCISFTFGLQYAEHYLRYLLKTEPRSLTSYMVSPASGWAGSYSIRQAALPTFRPNAQSSEGHPLLLIDYKADLRRGSIVPQSLWTPHSPTDQHQYVQSASLSLPIFFVHENGAVGLSVADAAAGRCQSLRGAGLPADMRDKASTHIRINWPGCVEWKRQFQTKDETEQRNPITLERLVRHVGRSIDHFLQQHEVDPKHPIPHWRIGHGGIARDNITVLGVCHVTSGSWMPILQVFPAVFDLQMPVPFET